MKYVFWQICCWFSKFSVVQLVLILNFFCLTNASAPFVRSRRELQHVDIFFANLIVNLPNA